MAEHHMTVDDGGLRERRVPVNYPGNSNNQKPGPPGEPKPPKEPVQPIINGKVRRKSNRSSIIVETGRSVWEYVLHDVLLPSLKDTLYDVITGGSQKALYKDMRPRGRGPTGYNQYGRPGVVTTPSSNPYTRRTVSPQARSTHVFDDIILETRDEADAVLGSMHDLVSKYGYATVADLLTLCNVDSVFTDGQWGWTDREIVNIRVALVQGGYLLRTPPTVPIVTN